MKVTSIEIKNVLGLSECKITPGKITEIEGANASGKTSVLEAIKAAFGGGHDATLLKQGEESGEIVLVLDDDVTIKKRITREKSSLSIRHPIFGKVSAPKSYIDNLVDSLSVNPVQFLSASKKDRVKILLEALPMKISLEDLKRAGVPESIRLTDPSDNHALVVIEEARRQIYAERTAVNRSVKDKRSTVRELEKTLPEMPEDGDWREKLNTLQEEYREHEAANLEKTQNIKERASRAEWNANESYREAVDSINAEFEAEIEKLRQKASDARRKLSDKRDEKIRKIQERKSELLESAEAEYTPRHEQLSEQIGHARAMLNAQVKAESTKELIARQLEEAREQEKTSKELTKAIENLDKLKSDLLSDLPVEGLEVRDGDIFVDGIPFDRVNESARISLALEIARIRSGELGLVLCDGLECLDSKTFEAFRKKALKTGLQFIVTRVSDEERLTIRDGGKEAA